MRLLFLSFFTALRCSNVAALKMRHEGKWPFWKEKAPRVYLVNFGTKDFKASADRFAKEANDTKLFDGIFHYTDFPEFIRSDKKWEQHLKAGKGAGWWFWKGPLVRNALNQMDEGDVLLYADSGCEMAPDFLKRLPDLAKDLCDHDMVVSSLAMPEKEWTKGDVFAEFGVSPNDKVYGESSQIKATFFWMRNTPRTRQFIQHWENLLANYHLVSDELSKTSNSRKFHEPRRDQSLFSMLLKANQPACRVNEDFCKTWHPVAPNRHEKYAVPGLRTLITAGNSPIVETRTRWGSKKLSSPKPLSIEEASTMKSQMTVCK